MAAKKPDRAPRQFAIAHAFMGVSYVATSDNFSNGKEPTILRLKTDGAKERFLIEELQPGDTFYMELGGPNDRLALLAHCKGVNVLRIPTFRIGNKERAKQTAETAGWSAEEEPRHGSESADKLTARKIRALAIAAEATTSPNEFFPIGEVDREHLLLKQHYRSFRQSQRTIMAGYQRLLSVYYDRYLLELVGRGELVEASGAKIPQASALEAIRAMLNTIPDEQRADFEAKIGLPKLAKKRFFAREDVMAVFRSLLHEMLDNDSIQSPFMANMRETKRTIERQLKADPIYRSVFEPLPGFGPLIAARMIAAIMDIRRFKTRPCLTAYAGYHHFEDGSRARRREGQVSNWAQELKQAVYLWTQQTIKMPQSPWRARLDLRKAYELYKLLYARQLEAMEQGMEEEILPVAFEARVIKSVNDMTAQDLGLLQAHVDALRLKAGVKRITTDEDEEDEEEADAKQDAAAKNPALAKLMRGVKQAAQDKALRWLGQQIIKHIYREWTEAEKAASRPEDVQTAAE